MVELDFLDESHNRERGGDIRKTYLIDIKSNDSPSSLDREEDEIDSKNLNATEQY